MVNFFSKILGSATSALGSVSSDSAVGIDIGSSFIKIVEVRKKGGKAVLETYGAIALGPYADTDVGRVTNLPVDKISEGLKELMKQAGVVSSSCALSIPVQSSLVFNIEIPSGVKDGDIDAVVRTEARKHVPVPISEVALDYFLLPEKEPSFQEMNDPDHPLKKKDKKEFLVVVIQNEQIDNLRKIVSSTNLSASFFEVEIFSSIRANFEHELSPVLLVDLGASRTKLSFVEFGMVKNYHSINRGGADITQSISQSLSMPFIKAEEMKKEFGLFGNPAEEQLFPIIKAHMDYIFSETNNVLLDYERSHGRTISKVMLTGGGSLTKGIYEFAEESLKLEIARGYPFAKVGAPVFLEKVLETTGPEFAIAIGLALRKLQ